VKRRELLWVVGARFTAAWKAWNIEGKKYSNSHMEFMKIRNGYWNIRGI
jgi:hypothetical protein